MIEHRPFGSLGFADHGWLQTRHHFSFAAYHDTRRMGWGALRVWNDDEIAPRNGFPTHPHRDMEIVTYVREGAITHEDSLGNKGRTKAGDVQVMSAGSGLRHSEVNCEDETTRLFQLWIFPREPSAAPAWGTRPFPRGARAGRFVALASGFAADADALPIRADARICGATLRSGETAIYPADPARHIYLVAARGTVSLNGLQLGERDGAAVTGEVDLRFEGLEDAEVILVDAA